MKNQRHAIILDILENNTVETQNELISELAKRGVKTTQATLSRDIKELRLVKEATPGGRYRYVAPDRAEETHGQKLRTIFRECVQSYVCAQNLVVIKTLPGLASAACSAIDKMDLDDFAGSLAGDDTAFIAMTDNDAAKRLCEIIEETL